ncbi:MAG: class I SAM-dependent RNA methyltransferase [Planctomycetaceae bacterium]
MPNFDLIAATTFGLEAVVARELEQLGHAERTVEDGRVIFPGDAAAVCRANLRLRCADRVLIRIGEFPARDFGELFDRTRELPWEEWIPLEGEFPVRGRSARSQLHNVPSCQSIVKKAIVERLRAAHGAQWFAETGSLFGIEVALKKDVATLTLDTSGPGLHKRGYRTLVGAAPLKETRAAGLIQLSYWNRDRILLDPFCGSGTIPIEAAFIARNRAPGLNRTFAAEGWRQFPAELWKQARDECRDLERPLGTGEIRGSDRDSRALELARQHAAAAGVADDIRFERAEFQSLDITGEYGCLIANPPYGERIGEQDETERLYRDMGRILGQLATWSIYVLTSHPAFEKLYGRRADRRRKLYNGRIECTYHQYQGPRPPRPIEEVASVE